MFLKNDAAKIGNSFQFSVISYQFCQFFASENWKLSTDNNKSCKPKCQRTLFL